MLNTAVRDVRMGCRMRKMDGSELRNTLGGMEMRKRGGSMERSEEKGEMRNV